MDSLNASVFTHTRLRTQLRHGRATELTGEGVRWFDLQRWGPLDTRANVVQFKARDPYFNNFVVSRSRLLPLVQTDVDLSKLTQNPGY